MRQFVVDLELPPDQRWAELVGAFKPQIQQLCAMQARASDELARANDPMGAMLGREAPRLLDRLTPEMAAEMRAVAGLAEVPLLALAMLHLNYEACCGCTAIGTCDGLLARSLDWELPPLAALNVQLEMHRAGQLLYRQVSWAGYLGVLTAVRPGQSALALNFRLGPVAAEHPEAVPVGLAARAVVEAAEDYEQLCRGLSGVTTMAGFYAMVLGPSGEGCVITRGSCGEDGPRAELCAGGYIVQANMDWWTESDKQTEDSQESRPRLRVCHRAMKALGGRPASRGELWGLLQQKPVFERGVTLYCCLMHVPSGELEVDSSPTGSGGRHTKNKRKKTRK